MCIDLPGDVVLMDSQDALYLVRNLERIANSLERASSALVEIARQQDRIADNLEMIQGAIDDHGDRS